MTRPRIRVAREGGHAPGPGVRTIWAVAIAGVIRTPWRHEREDALADAIDEGFATMRGRQLYWDAAAQLVSDGVADAPELLRVPHLGTALAR